MPHATRHVCAFRIFSPLPAEETDACEFQPRHLGQDSRFSLLCRLTKCKAEGVSLKVYVSDPSEPAGVTWYEVEGYRRRLDSDGNTALVFDVPGTKLVRVTVRGEGKALDKSSLQIKACIRID